MRRKHNLLLLALLLPSVLTGSINRPAYAHPGHEGEDVPLSPGYEFYESKPHQQAYESIAECAALFQIAAEADEQRRIWDDETRALFEKRIKSYMEGAIRIARKQEVLNPVSGTREFFDARYAAWKKRWEETTLERFHEMRQEHLAWLNYCEDLEKTYFLQPKD